MPQKGFPYFLFPASGPEHQKNRFADLVVKYHSPAIQSGNSVLELGGTQAQDEQYPSWTPNATFSPIFPFTTVDLLATEATVLCERNGGGRRRLYQIGTRCHGRPPAALCLVRVLRLYLHGIDGSTSLCMIPHSVSSEPEPSSGMLDDCESRMDAARFGSRRYSVLIKGAS